ncbi:MAG: hypothetical protein SAJ37_23145 [Oscillatoria sp. PMC 1068.18]|nr:hypothetical protein [Oscillatoria sp. PMC 1076.18]MEC4991643.1 hypothetical protein [Oscillatoria sp. PMC 1068.18]
MSVAPRSLGNSQSRRSRKTLNSERSTNNKVSRYPYYSTKVQKNKRTVKKVEMLATRDPVQRLEFSTLRGTKMPAEYASAQKVPFWLRLLMFLQYSSSVVTFSLVTGTLIIYAWTVYTQQQWSKEYKKLETLQRNERQLTTTNESLKSQLAEQAETPESGLVPPNPKNTIFLTPTPEQSSFIDTETGNQESREKTNTPLGY